MMRSRLYSSWQSTVRDRRRVCACAAISVEWDTIKQASSVAVSLVFPFAVNVFQLGDNL